jgi:transposase InsO family protein
LKKSEALLGQRTALRDAFMAEPQETGPVAVLCAVLEGRRRGFYTSLQRQAASPVDREQVEFIARVQALAAQTRQSYGSRRMAKHLQAEGSSVGRDRARRLRPQAGVVGHRPAQRRPQTTDRRHQHGVAATLLARQGDVEPSDQAWVGDSTYVWTAAGWR